MKRLILATSLVFAGALQASAADCAKDYKEFWDQFNGGPAKSLNGAQLATATRAAVRAYDACSAGDEASAKSLFSRIQEAAPAKGDDYWKQLGSSAPAKK